MTLSSNKVAVKSLSRVPQESYQTYEMGVRSCFSDEKLENPPIHIFPMAGLNTNWNIYRFLSAVNQQLNDRFRFYAQVCVYSSAIGRVVGELNLCFSTGIKHLWWQARKTCLHSRRRRSRTFSTTASTARRLPGCSLPPFVTTKNPLIKGKRGP